MSFISGYHHLTLSTDGAQEDYDFYTKTLGLHSIKRTVLFDGTIPVYHLYYGSQAGDASTIITTFPFRKPGIYGRRGTNQSRTIMQSIPVGAADYWVDRLNQHGIPATKGDRFGLTRVMFAHPCGIPHELVENPGDTRKPITNDAQGIGSAHGIRGIFGGTVAVMDATSMEEFLDGGMQFRRDIGEAGLERVGEGGQRGDDGRGGAGAAGRRCGGSRRGGHNIRISRGRLRNGARLPPLRSMLPHHRCRLAAINGGQRGRIGHAQHRALLEQVDVAVDEGLGVGAQQCDHGLVHGVALRARQRRGHLRQRLSTPHGRQRIARRDLRGRRSGNRCGRGRANCCATLGSRVALIIGRISSAAASNSVTGMRGASTA